MNELWKNIDIATNYEVSNLGRVRNTKTGQILNPGVSGNGYKQVSIKFKDTNKFKKQYIHRLVAQYWLENPENKREVNHINLDRTDNRVENLEWITSMFQEHEIEITDELLSELFDKIQEQDWRYGSCGGCI